jgi:hypothetical protein
LHWLQAEDSTGLKLYDDAGTGLFVEDGGFIGIYGITNPTVALDIGGAVKVLPGTAPGSPTEGMIYGKLSDHSLQYYNGSSWVDLTAGGGGAGDITAIGNVTTGVAFTETGDQGASLWFEGTTVDTYEVKLTSEDATADSTLTMPADVTAYIVLDATKCTDLEGAGLAIGGGTLGFLSTELDALTWSDGSNASNVWTFDVSGTDHTMTIGNALVTFSGGLTTSLDLVVTGGDITLGSTSIFSGGDTASLNNIDAGGTGASTFTDGGILIGDGPNAIVASAVLANGELLIGDNDSDPVAATLTGTANEIAITNAAGSITIGIPDSPVLVTPALGTIASGVGTALTALDGENIQDGTIDDDSLDLSGPDGLTGADLDLSDCGAITSTAGTITATVGFDVVGAADMDYGSADVTDHTFIADGGTVVIDGSILFPDTDTSPATAGALLYDNTVTGITDGLMVWYDDDAVRYLIDLDALPSDDDYVVAYDADNDKFYMKADATGGTTAWDDIGNPDASAEIDFAAYVIELNVSDFQVGDGGGANYVGFDGTPTMTFNGTADIDLPASSVDEDDLAVSGAAGDNYLLSYRTESGGDFEWKTIGDIMGEYQVGFFDTGIMTIPLKLQAGSNGYDGRFVIYSEQGSPDYAVEFHPHATMTETSIYYLPAADGSSGQVLHTDGSGNLSWNTDDGAGSGSMTTVKIDGVQQGGSDIVTLDFFGADFDASEGPDTEINLSIDSAITRDAEWDTTGEVETIWSVDLITAGEVDSYAEMLALITGGENDANIISESSSDTLTNKIFSATGAGNVLTNIDEDNCQDACDLVRSAIEFVVDGGGSAIGTGVAGDIEIPFNCVIQRCTLLADQSGAIAIDIWVDTYANYPPTDADSITAAAVPEIAASGVKDQDTSLSGWTTSLSAGDTMRFNVDSCTTITRCTLSLIVEK